MKMRAFVINPEHRDRRLRTVARHLGINDIGGLSSLRMAMTPPLLAALPMHVMRGKKSLTRIQQINNRRRFKSRDRVSR